MQQICDYLERLNLKANHEIPGRMKKHVRIYMKFFGYGIDDFIPSEISGARANDVHHIDCRGMGGSKEMDVIENLMALTRAEHDEYGDKEQYMEFLRETHKQYLNNKINQNRNGKTIY
jgi:hypothetical protein